MESRFVTIAGERFHIRLAGPEGAPPVLLLHGFPEYSGAWEEVAARLAPRLRVIAPDQRGYGRSPAPPEVAAYALRRLVADMAGLIARIGAPVTVVGHDWGASVAYGLAIFRPELVARLVILNGVHPIPFQRALAAGGAQTRASQYILKLREEGIEARLAADGFARLLRAFSAQMDMGWLTPGRLARYRAEWARPGRLTGMLNWYRASPLVVPPPGRALADPPRLDPAALRVRVPHLLIWGREDTALLPEATEGLEALCDDLTRITLPGCDHWLHHQKPDEVARLIAEFAGA
ncbi:MAG: alpha/beta hydrolase [Paracoccaceae bacterium]|nr:MAG: alpha/beta hydrolase [Alphaproteobacteria bacterium]GIX12225.1 MAG: alpha/beta hydrolase [Paracoccaceae bacterium]